VLHEAVTHGCGMAVLNYLVGVVIRYERERVWMGRGELKPVSFQFSSSSSTAEEVKERHNTVTLTDACDDVMVEPYNPKPDVPLSSSPSSSISSPYQYHTHTTLFNTTDDLGRTILHCLILRVCRELHHHHHPHNHTSTTQQKRRQLDYEATNQVIEMLLKAFPPAVAKLDRDGNTPLDLVIMTSTQHPQHHLPLQQQEQQQQQQQQRRVRPRRNTIWQGEGSMRDMEVEMRVLGLVRSMLDVYPLAACTSVNSAHVTIRRPYQRTNTTTTTSRLGSGSGGSNVRSLSSPSTSRLRTITDIVDGTIAPTSLSHALTYGRHFTTVQLLLEAGKLALTPWHTGLLHDTVQMNWNDDYYCSTNSNNTGDDDDTFLREMENPSCMAVVSVDHEVPLHVAVTMRASEEIVSEVSNAGMRAVVVPDRCGLNSICWLWMRFVMDCSCSGSIMEGGWGRGRRSDIESMSRHGLPAVRVSQRRLLPGDYVQLHEAVTEDLFAGIVGRCTKNSNDDDDNDDDDSEQTQLWNKLTTLLPHAARAIAAHSNGNSNSNTATTLTTSVVQFHWPVLHAASFLDCPRAIVAMALQRTSYQEEEDNGTSSSSSSSSSSSFRDKDAHGNLPIHYAASRSGYIRYNLPLVYGTTATTSSAASKSIVERSIVYDLLSLWPRGARITNDSGRLPLHIAIDEEKQSRNSSSSRLQEEGRSSLISPRHRHPRDQRSLRQMEASWSTSSAVVLSLFDSYPEGLERRDGLTKLYPFMQAAVGECAGLDMVFTLLMKNPAIVK